MKGTIRSPSSQVLPAVMFDLMTVDTNCDIIDIHQFVVVSLGRSWSVASRTDHIDLYIVHILEFVFALSILAPIRMIGMIRLNAPFITHSLHLQYPFVLICLGIHYAMALGAN
jgi:hypothetical protein